MVHSLGLVDPVWSQQRRELGEPSEVPILFVLSGPLKANADTQLVTAQGPHLSRKYKICPLSRGTPTSARLGCNFPCWDEN